MKRASYRDAVQWIAWNDENGDETYRLDPEAVGDYVSSAIVADLFGITTEKVAKDVIRYRKNIIDTELR